MRVEEIEERIIYGISTRTKNSNEMNPKTAKIGTIWQKFDSTVEVNYKDVLENKKRIPVDLKQHPDFLINLDFYPKTVEYLLSVK